MTRFLVLLIGDSLIDDSWVDCYIFARSVILQEVAIIVTARLEGPLTITSLKDSRSTARLSDIRCWSLNDSCSHSCVTVPHWLIRVRERS